MLANQKTKSNVIIIAPLSSLSLRTRLYKLATFLNNYQAIKITHIGWERLPNESEEHRFDFEIRKKIILKGGGYGSGRKYLYLLWMIRVFFNGFKINKNDIVWALGFESAFPLLLSSKIKGYTLYFDDADRFSMLIKNRVLRYIVKILEVFTSYNVKKHIIPSLDRYNFSSNNFFLMPNVPSKDALLKAKNIYKNRMWKKFDLTINVNGWLSKSRGIAIILEICDELKANNIGIIMAGKLYCDEAILLSKKENVDYLGDVSNEEALASYYASDFVFTYYDPISEINKYAASNKWGDALKTGVGIIVNNEVVNADRMVNQRIAIGFDYNDVDGLLEGLKQLSKNKTNLNIVKNRVLDLGENTLCFESNIKKIFDLG